MNHPHGYNAVKIRQDGSRFYLSFYNRGTKSKRDFATIKGAIRHCEAMEYEVDMDDLPNPNAKSVVRKIQMMPDGTLMMIENGVVKIIAPNVEALNPVLRRLGYKPVRITRNNITGNGTPFLIDADTPMCCDPGTETYHSM
jgi:hypothetical protein